MKGAKRRKLRMAITITLLILFLWANFYTIRMAAHYGVVLYLYDKLRVAYQIGGDAGMRKELENILANEPKHRENIVIKKFAERLDNIKDPDEFLKDAVEDNRNKLRLYRNLRNVAFGLIVAVFLLRFIVDRFIREE